MLESWAVHKSMPAEPTPRCPMLARQVTVPRANTSRPPSAPTPTPEVCSQPPLRGRGLRVHGLRGARPGLRPRQHRVQQLPPPVHAVQHRLLAVPQLFLTLQGRRLDVGLEILGVREWVR